MNPAKIRVLVADDSAVSRTLLVHLLEQDPRIEVLGAVVDGCEALTFLEKGRPDVIVMDLHMPKMDGFEATRRIMETHPLPIVICTATNDAQEVAITFRSMEAGAVACVAKPVSPGHDGFEAVTAELLQTVKLMSEVKVVRRWPRGPNGRAHVVPRPAQPTECPSGMRVVGIGASTGGPPVLQSILMGLPKDFSLPVLIVQHIAQGFVNGLVDWLAHTTGWPVQIAVHGACPLPGHAYLAPDDFHMALAPSGRILLSREPAVGGLRPAVSFLFRTLAEVCGPDAIGVLLTGMGRDGADELKLMREAGAETIAQDRESSIIHGMPGEAIAIGAASQILPADRVADFLISLVKRRALARGEVS
jgi:two-component system chemotaxis response regulator CheB